MSEEEGKGSSAIEHEFANSNNYDAITIRRTTGRLEKFDVKKMALDISRSGASFLMAKEIANAIVNKITQSGVHEGVIDGHEIRKMVAEELNARNRQDIARSFLGEKPLNVEEGGGKVTNKNEPVIDHVAVHRGNIIYDGTTHFAKSTKGEGVKK